MKRIVALFLSVLTALTMTLPAFAIDIDLDDFYGLTDDDDTSYNLVPENYLTDNANILTDDEEENIQEALEDVSEKYEIDVLVYTTRDVPQDDEWACEEFTNEILDQYLYENSVTDAVIFVVDMDYRLWYIATESRGKWAISNEYGIGFFEDKLIGYLSDGDYEECFLKYAELCDKFFAAYEKGKPYSRAHPYITVGLILKALLIGAVAGLVIALIVTSVLKKQLKSVEKQRTANNYVRRGSFKLTNSQDLFLYKNVTKVRRQSSSSGGGGRSGGGGSRGGGGGRF